MQRALVTYRRVNILVVDDDVDLCTLLSRFLEKNGMRVHSAQDALQALDVLEREPIGMIITDYQMPHMDGVRFTEMVRQDPRFEKIQIILITGQPTDEVMDVGLKKGVAMALPKPIDFRQLLDLVRFAE